MPEVKVLCTSTALYAAALLEELESLVEQLDQQEASKKQALDRAEAAERDLEALKLQQNSVTSLDCTYSYLLLHLTLSHCLVVILLFTAHESKACCQI